MKAKYDMSPNWFSGTPCDIDFIKLLWYLLIISILLIGNDQRCWFLNHHGYQFEGFIPCYGQIYDVTFSKLKPCYGQICDMTFLN